MSRRCGRWCLRAALSAALIGCAAAGFAQASSVQSMLQQALQPSAAPALLGPITEGGRTGWTCKPEQAASAQKPAAAELPSPDDTH